MFYDIHRFPTLLGRGRLLPRPTAYIPNYDADWVARASRIGTVIATGEHDYLAQANRDFAALLQGKGIPVHHEIWQGVNGHDWPWWREHLRRFVP